MSNGVPKIRIRKINDKEVHSNGDYVLYWMTAYRRIKWNFSLQRAVEWALELKKPLVILEAIRCGYPWASDRIHQFIMDGMAQHARQLKARKSVLYYPYLEKRPGEGKGFLKALSKKACLVVTDDLPCFFLPHMLASASRQIDVPMETVDSCGLLPMRAAGQVFPTAYAFRRFLQKVLPKHLMDFPKPDPLKNIRLSPIEDITNTIGKQWPKASISELVDKKTVSGIILDHDVSVVSTQGGAQPAEKILQMFLEDRLPVYHEKHNDPEEEGTSGLSPYLHFGHISVCQVFHELAEMEDWFFHRLSENTKGSKKGWWGMSAAAEAFLDELVTWRELGFNMCWQWSNYDRYVSLPQWARSTLEAHALDERPYRYAMKDFETANTHDPLWNAAQIQLFKEGKIHNYLRMLWGKKILEWSHSPQKALDIMVHLNNKYAMDGRDPNSYSGIFWILGRYDRAWGPERPIFGKIRYMSSKNTARKFKVNKYIEKYSP